MNEPSDDSSPRTRMVALLEALFGQDARWQPIPNPGGATITRGWADESVDTLVILSPDIAYAWREDPHGQQAQRVRGTAEAVVAACRHWVTSPAESDTKEAADHTPGRDDRWRI